MKEQPSFAELDYQHKRRPDPAGGVSGAAGILDSLAEAGKSH